MYVSLRNKSNVYLESRCWCLNDLTYWCQLTNDSYIVISNNVWIAAKLMIIFYIQPDNDIIIHKLNINQVDLYLKTEYRFRFCTPIKC